MLFSLARFLFYYFRSKPSTDIFVRRYDKKRRQLSKGNIFLVDVFHLMMECIKVSIKISSYNKQK